MAKHSKKSNASNSKLKVNMSAKSTSSKTYSADFSSDDDFAEIKEPEIPESQVQVAEADSINATEDIKADEYTYKPRKEATPVKDKKNNSPENKQKLFKILIPVASLLVVFVLFLALPLFLPGNAIASNVWSGDINLGKMSIEEANEALSDIYSPEKIDFSVTYTANGKFVRTSFTSDDINLRISADKTANEAYNVGRSGNMFQNSWDILRSFFAPIDVGSIPECDIEKLEDIFYDLGSKIHGQGEDISYVIEDNVLTITPAVPGQSHNVSEAIDEFLTSIQNGIYSDIPLTLKSNESDKLDADELYNELCTQPKDAEYRIENNKAIITDHVVGIELDKAKLSALVDQVNNGTKGSIEVIETKPSVTTEKLQESLFGTTLATFSSSYSTSSANRAHNVELAAQKINGYILADGAEFSYNDVVGNANLANGFKMATVYSGGRVTEGVGGGVCQVSSTLYCSVLRADLEVLERRNHSLPITYVPGGQDATVSYDSLDFRFKNNTGSPIKIVASWSNRNLTVSILGSKEAKKRVEVISEKTSSVAPTMTEIPDPTLEVGQTKVKSSGKSGSVYVTYKRVYDSAGKLVSESKVTSKYKATAGEILVGTKPVEGEGTDPANPEEPTQPTNSPSDDSENSDDSQPTVSIPSTPENDSEDTNDSSEPTDSENE